jgi:SAM-dependent methyltransferase
VTNTHFTDLLRSNPDPEFGYVDPPFNFNAAGVTKYPPEISGFYLLNSLCRRLGWPSLSGKRLLDYGCGVRFTRTLINLSMDIGAYAGIDVNKKSIAWLKENVKDPRFRFECLDMQNPKYNRQGAIETDPDLLKKLGIEGYDAACMYSVITHQTPEEAKVILSMLRKSIPDGGDLYFTGLIDDKVSDFVEQDPARPGQLSTYNPDFLIHIVEATGWKVKATFAPSQFQQAGFHCR